MSRPRRTAGTKRTSDANPGADARVRSPKAAMPSIQGLTKKIEALEKELAATREERDELQVDEGRWRSLAEQSPLGIIAYRPDGTVKYANPALTRLFELTQQEHDLLVAHYNILEDPQLREAGALGLIRRAFAGEVTILPTVEYRRASPIEGHPVRRLLEGLMYPVRDRKGAIREVVLIHTDITPLKTAQEDLRKSRDQLRRQLAELEHLYATAPVGLALVDPDLRYVRINEMMAAINGRTTEEHVGRAIREVLPDLADDLEPVYRRVIETGEPALDIELPRGDRGRAGHGAGLAGEGYHPLRSEEGRVSAVSTVVRDITNRKPAETALRESQERFRELAENIREVFWLFDLEKQQVVYASPAFEAVWGRSLQSLYEDYGEWGRSVHPEDRAFAEESFARIAGSEGGETREYRILRPDGEVRWISDLGFVVRDDAGRAVRVAGIAEDITERKRQEAEHRHFEARIQHAQKLESLGVLAGGIAHDFNNLLMGILGNADLASGEARPGVAEPGVPREDQGRAQRPPS